MVSDTRTTKHIRITDRRDPGWQIHVLCNGGFAFLQRTLLANVLHLNTQIFLAVDQTDVAELDGKPDECAILDLFSKVSRRFYRQRLAAAPPSVIRRTRLSGVMLTPLVGLDPDRLSRFSRYRPLDLRSSEGGCRRVRPNHRREPFARSRGRRRRLRDWRGRATRGRWLTS